MVEEFYGPTYAFHRTAEHQPLEELFKAKPEAQNSILDFMKVNRESVAELSVCVRKNGYMWLYSYFIHFFILFYFLPFRPKY